MIVIKNLTLRRGVKVVLDKANLTLNPGEKVGLVGRNGAGKSSLFSLLTHRLASDAGDATVPAKWRMAEVAQSMPETEDGATAFVLEGDTRLMEAEAVLPLQKRLTMGMPWPMRINNSQKPDRSTLGRGRRRC
jgi:ATP-binding cassette subfamily F protein 3